MTAGLVTSAEDLAIESLTFLASRVGEATLRDVLDVVMGDGTQVLSEELSQLVGGLCSSILVTLGPDRVKDAVTDIFTAADAAVDALENAKFPVKP